MLNCLIIALGGLCLIPFPYMNLPIPFHLVFYGLAGVVFGIYGARETSRSSSPLSRTILLSLLFCAVLILSSFMSKGGLKIGLKASAGVLLRGVAPALASFALVRWHGKETRLHRYLIVLGGVVAFSAVFEVMTGHYFIFERHPILNLGVRTHFSPEYGIAVGAFGQPLVLGSFLCVIFPMSLAAWREKRSFLNASVVLSVLLAMVLTFRRSTYALALLTLFWFGFRFFRIRWVVAGIVTVLFFVALLNIAVPKIRHRILARFDVANTWTEVKTAQRTHSYQTVWRMLKEKPIFGFGPRQFERVYLNYSKHEHPYETPDNQYLRILAENGLVGFFAFLSLLGLVLMMAVRNRGTPVGWGRLSAMVNFMSAMVFLDALYWPALQMMFWILIGTIDGTNHEKIA